MAITVKDYMNAVLQTKNSIPKQTEIILNKNKEVILDLNRDTLFEGENNEGKTIGFYKITVFGSGKGHPKISGTSFNFYDSGNFFKGFDFIVRNNVLSFFSRAKISSELQERYGSNIFGLKSEKENQLNKIIQTDLWEFLRKSL